jgi:hypothetical protein
MSTLLVSGSPAGATLPGGYSGYYVTLEKDGVATLPRFTGPLLYPVFNGLADLTVPTISCGPAENSAGGVFAGALHPDDSVGIQFECNAGTPGWFPVYVQNGTSHQMPNAGTVSPGDSIQLTASFPGVSGTGSITALQILDLGSCGTSACQWDAQVNLEPAKPVTDFGCAVGAGQGALGQLPLPHFSTFSITGCSYGTYPPEAIGQNDPDTDCMTPNSNNSCYLPAVPNPGPNSNNSARIHRLALIGSTGNQLVSLSRPRTNGEMTFTWLTAS